MAMRSDSLRRSDGDFVEFEADGPALTERIAFCVLDETYDLQ